MSPAVYFFLFLVTFLGFFASGFQDVGLLVFVHPMLVLFYYRWTYRKELTTSMSFLDRAVLPTLSLTISHAVAFSGLFNDPDWEFDGVIQVVIMSLVWSVVVGVMCYLAVARFQNRFDCAQWFQSILFALFYTALFFVLRIGTPVGNFANPALSLRNYPDLVQITSVLGIEALVFVIGWTAGVGADWLAACFIEGTDPNDDDSTAGEAVVVKKSLDSLWTRFRGSITSWMIAMCLVFAFGGIVSHNVSETFYQRSFNKYMPQSIPAACIISQGHLSLTELFGQTIQQADMGRELIMWSETAIKVTSKAMKQDLQSNASSIAQTYNIYVGVAYEDTFRSSHRNIFELYGPGGKLLSHQKRHPTPGVEDNIEAGHSPLQTANTKWGTVAAATSFDLDFPDYIMTAGQKDVKLLLQPSLTWGPLAEYHFYDSGFRAVENGLTLFRCSSVGYSGVVDAQFRVHSMIPANENAAFPIEIPLQGRRFAVFPHYGFLFGWIVLGFAGIFWLLTLCPTVGILYLAEHLGSFGKTCARWFPLRETSNDAVHAFDEEEDAPVSFNVNMNYQPSASALDSTSPTPAAPPALVSAYQHNGADEEDDPAAQDEYYDRDSEVEDSRGSFVYVAPQH